MVIKIFEFKKEYINEKYEIHSVLFSWGGWVGMGGIYFLKDFFL
jgi:hypothetical protein